MSRCRTAIVLAATAALCSLASAVAAQPTCADLVLNGGQWNGKPVDDLSVAQIDALLEIAGKCNPQTSSYDEDALLGFVLRLKGTRGQAAAVEAQQEKARPYRQELVELIKRTRALPNDPSSNAALQKLKIRLIEIRNESVEAFASNEWVDLDTAIDQKADAIQSAQTQPANPSSNPPALQNFADQSSSEPRISEMTCSVRGTAVLRVPNMGSEDPENEVEVGLTSAGDFIVEGKQIAAVDVVRNGGTITFSMISAEDYLLAGSKDATGASMGLSDDENMQFQAMQKMFLGGALHGRKRFAIYDVANSRLAFADADGQQFKNISGANCMAN